MKTLDAIKDLLAELDANEITYVHWKSNEALARSADGRNDLDLLIDGQSMERFEDVLTDLGFLPAVAPTYSQVPGITDFYGLDFGSNRLIHVHTHARLVLGDDATKNYHFPFHSEYLESRHRHEPFWVPSVEWEYLVFVARMILKHCPPDVIIGRRGRLTTSEKRELQHLENLVDHDEVARLREQHLPEVSTELWEAGRRAIESTSSAPERSAAGLRFQNAVAAHGRVGPFRETVRRNYRRSVHPLRKHHRTYRPKRVPELGGLFVSFVGSDGSGKSTAVAGVADMLRDDLWVVTGHLGKPPRSLLSKLLRRATRSILDPERLASLSRPAWETSADEQGFVFWLWHLAIARDRYREVRRLRRLVGLGAIVISDRFPSAALSTMDCPRIEIGKRSSPVARILSSREQWYYGKVGAPDLMLVLVVPSETALHRSGQDREFVTRRSSEVAARDWNGRGVVTIDGQMSAKDVRFTALSAVWAAITADRSSPPS
jgi:thymidylate kinase